MPGLKTNMKVLLQINTVVNSGSTGRIAEQIGQLAIENGWESYIAYARNEGDSKSKKIKIGTKFDVYLHVLVTRLFDRHGLGSGISTKRFIQKVKSIKPNIIHLHNIHGYYINYKLLFNYLSRVNIPIIWTLHDCWTFTGHCAYFSFVGCNRWMGICFRCPQKKMYPASIFFDRSRKNMLDKKNNFLSLKKNMILIPVSDWQAQLCSKSFFKNTLMKRIYNGVDVDVFHPALKENRKEIFDRYKIQTDFLVLGVASVWEKRKGYNDFIELRSLLSKEYSILLVGLSEKKIKSLPDGILGITGIENVKDLAKIYANSDVFVNPTWEDNFPTTNLESLACGTPVVAYNTGGCKELIKEDIGFIVRQGDIKVLAECIQKIIKRGGDYYVDNCRKYVVNNFKREDRYAEYIHLYNSLLDLDN
jgi:glycosyltransferase involved in cell wall biosynthesis